VALSTASAAAALISEVVCVDEEPFCIAEEIGFWRLDSVVVECVLFEMNAGAI
jgi:hypothetical protein